MRGLTRVLAAVVALAMSAGSALATMGFQFKHRIFELLEQRVGRRVVEANVCPLVGKQIGSFLFGIPSQRLPSWICVRPVSPQDVVESENLRR